MNKQIRTIGRLLILAAITFWISWFLMPDPGTTDTEHILKIVKQSRKTVLYSVIIQIISSVLYLIALFLLVKSNLIRKKTLAGAVLLGIGAMGLCADAFFHLLAYYMTDISVNIQQDVIQVMNFMQTNALTFLIPLLLPFFIGSYLLTNSFRKHEVISGLPQRIITSAFIIGIVSAIAVKINISKEGIPMLAILGLFAAGQVLAGFQISCISKKSAVPVFRNNF